MTNQEPDRNVNVRPSRRPFGSQTQKLAYEKREGFFRRWFNDTPGRIDAAREAGYKIVKDKAGKEVARPVGVYDNGVAMMAYLMEIPQEWYDEDMAAQQALLDQTDEAIKRGALQGRPGKDGVYIPAQGIKIESSNRR